MNRTVRLAGVPARPDVTPAWHTEEVAYCLSAHVLYRSSAPLLDENGRPKRSAVCCDAQEPA